MPKAGHLIGDIRYAGGANAAAQTTCTCGFGPVPYVEWEVHRAENNKPRGHHGGDGQQSPGRYTGQVWGTEAITTLDKS